MKMVPYSFSGSIPAKFEHKLRRHESGHLRVDGVLNGTEERFHNNAVLVIGFPGIM